LLERNHINERCEVPVLVFIEAPPQGITVKQSEA
jgi:hypothetical protein